VHTENSVRINQHTCGTLIADLVDALSLLASTSQSKDWKSLPRPVVECIKVLGVRVAKSHVTDIYRDLPPVIDQRTSFLPSTKRLSLIHRQFGQLRLCPPPGDLVPRLHMKAQLSLLSRIIPQVTEAKRAAIRESVASGASLTGAYLAMNLAAALIASFGLIENSPAVIIGAMLIAMLYGPIVGIALGLAEANLHLLRRALLAEVVGAVLVLVTGLLIGISTRDLTIGSEILSRNSPSLVDLL
jgi:hypothetical protein